MKINDSLKTQVDLTSTNQPVKSDRAEVKAEVSTPPSHTVQISNLSTQLQAMQNAQASGAVFESKKVEEIKAAISEGRFQVNAEKVADGLLDTVKDLLSSRRRPT